MKEKRPLEERKDQLKTGSHSEGGAQLKIQTLKEVGGWRAAVRNNFLHPGLCSVVARSQVTLSDGDHWPRTCRSADTNFLLLGVSLERKQRKKERKVKKRESSSKLVSSPMSPELMLQNVSVLYMV